MFDDSMRENLLRAMPQYRLRCVPPFVCLNSCKLFDDGTRRCQESPLVQEALRKGWEGSLSRQPKSKSLLRFGIGIDSMRISCKNGWLRIKENA